MMLAEHSHNEKHCHIYIYFQSMKLDFSSCIKYFEYYILVCLYDIVYILVCLYDIVYFKNSLIHAMYFSRVAHKDIVI
jgi:hypothetical protein